MRPRRVAGFARIPIVAIALATFALAENPDSATADYAFIGSVVDARDLGDEFPKDNLIPRGLVVLLGDKTYACYDIDLLRVAAVWKGDFLAKEGITRKSYDEPKNKAGGGIDKLPKVLGTPLLATGIYAGWQAGSDPSFEDPRPPGPDPKDVGRGALPREMGRWQSAQPNSSPMLNYTVGESTEINEIPRLDPNNSEVFERWFTIRGNEQPITTILGEFRDARIVDEDTGRISLDVGNGERVVFATTAGELRWRTAAT